MSKIKQFISTDTIIGVMAYDVVIVRSDSGIVVAELKAPVMHSIEGDSGILEFPNGFHAILYEDGKKPSSTITADYGISYENSQLVVAKNNVVVENTETKEVMNTELLYWYRKTRKIRTASPIKITTPDKIIFGDSLNANEDFTQRVIHGIKATLELEEEEE